MNDNLTKTDIFLIIFFVSLFGVFHPTPKIFANMEKSPLPVKGCIFLPMLGTLGHRAVRVLAVPHLLWAYIYSSHFRGPVTLTPNAEHLAVELSLPVLILSL